MLSESSLSDLYQSIINGFPHTTKRQHSVDEIKVAQLHITPFRNMRTIFFKGLTENKGNGHQYNSIILFKNVIFPAHETDTMIEIVGNDGNEYAIEPLTMNQDVRCRCNCKDFRYRMAWYDHLDHSLYNHPPKHYERVVPPSGLPPANPNEVPGLCKHILSLERALRHSGILFTPA